MIQCPSCRERFDAPPDRSTAACPACGYVAVVGRGPAAAEGEDPHTAPFLDPLNPAEDPTRIGVAAQTLALPRGKRVSVVVLSGPRKGDRIALEHPRLAMGRSGGGADLEVPDPDVSRQHAALECHGSRIVLRDLGSRNGTFVGERRVTSQEVGDRMEFRLAGTTFLVLLADTE